MRVTENFHFLYGLYAGAVGIIRSAGEFALVDTGWTPESVDHIAFQLQATCQRERLKYIIITHADWDHIGGLQRFQQEYGGSVVAHEAEVARIEKPTWLPQYLELTSPSGRLEAPPIAPAKVDVRLRDDQTLRVGDLELEVLCTPGHSHGDLCIYHRDNGILYSGDTVIPTDWYHPYFGRYIRTPLLRGNLGVYLQSLKKLSNLRLSYILPGHGRPVQDGRGLIAELVQVTEGLKGKVLSLLEEPLTPSEVDGMTQSFPFSTTLRVIDELLREGKVERLGTRCLHEEPTYRRKRPGREVSSS